MYALSRVDRWLFRVSLQFWHQISQLNKSFPYHGSQLSRNTNYGKTVAVLAIVLTLAIAMMYQQPVLAQNVTTGGNMTSGGGEAENMTATEQSGDISSIAIDQKGAGPEKPVKKPN